MLRDGHPSHQTLSYLWQEMTSQGRSTRPQIEKLKLPFLLAQSSQQVTALPAKPIITAETTICRRSKAGFAAFARRPALILQGSCYVFLRHIYGNELAVQWQRLRGSYRDTTHSPETAANAPFGNEGSGVVYATRGLVCGDPFRWRLP